MWETSQTEDGMNMFRNIYDNCENRMEEMRLRLTRQSIAGLWIKVEATYAQLIQNRG